MTECSETLFPFETHRISDGQFTRDRLTTDGGALLLRRLIARFSLLRRVVACFTDYRQPERIERHLEGMLAEHRTGLALGYEDLNDHEQLRQEFAALTGHKVVTGLWDEAGSTEGTYESSIEHIGEAQWAEALVVAPATAHTLAKFAHGIADDFHHHHVPGHRSSRPGRSRHECEHVESPGDAGEISTSFGERGVRVIEPGTGDLACGMVGTGRMAEPKRSPMPCSVCSTGGSVTSARYGSCSATRRDGPLPEIAAASAMMRPPLQNFL